MTLSPGFGSGRDYEEGLFLDDGHDVVFTHDQQIFAVDFHLGARVLAEQHLVALLEIERPDFAVLEDLALTDRDYLALDRLLGSGVGNDDAAGGLSLFFGTSNDDAIVQRTQLHDCSPFLRL